MKMYKIDVATDPFNECDKDQPKVETFEHLLCDCHLLNETRKVAMSAPVVYVGYSFATCLLLLFFGLYTISNS